MAERNGSIFRRRLRSAERLRERAISLGSSSVKTPSFRSRALLVSVTCWDQRFEAAAIAASGGLLGARLRGLLGRGRALLRTLGARRPTGRRGALRDGTFGRRLFRLGGEGFLRGGGVAFLLQGRRGRPGAGARNGLLRTLRSYLGVALGLFPGRLGGGPLLGRRQLHAGAARFRKPDRDRLLGRPRPVLPFLDVLDLLVDELARLGARGLALSLVLAGLLDRLLLGHGVGLLFWRNPEARSTPGAAAPHPLSKIRYGTARRISDSGTWPARALASESSRRLRMPRSRAAARRRFGGSPWAIRSARSSSGTKSS